MSELDKLIAALAELAEVNRKIAADIRMAREMVFGTPDEGEPDGCRYCAEGRSHTAGLCKRSGGEG